MQTGAITGYIDVAQLTLYAFWIFFAGLIYYLRREDKREGYPLKSDRSDHVRVEGFPPMPKPKVFILPHGGSTLAPRPEAPETVAAAYSANWPGAPLMPTSNPLVDGLGAAAYAARADVPDHTFDTGLPRIVPLRAAPHCFLATEDPDPRGMTVYGADRVAAGTVVEAWIDRTEVILRYLEVEVAAPSGPRRVLLPMNFLKINKNTRRITVGALLAHQFAGVPGLREPDQVTLLEEDRITAYYAGGTLYATPRRMEPLL